MLKLEGKGTSCQRVDDKNNDRVRQELKKDFILEQIWQVFRVAV